MSPGAIVGLAILGIVVGVAVAIVAGSIGVSADPRRTRPWAIATGVGLAILAGGIIGIVYGIAVAIVHAVT